MTDTKITKSRRKKDPSRPTDDVAGFAVHSEAPSHAMRERPVEAEAMSDDERRRMIAERAYARAESRGFTNGSPERDWLEAEEEVIQLLANAGLRT